MIICRRLAWEKWDRLNFLGNREHSKVFNVMARVISGKAEFMRGYVLKTVLLIAGVLGLSGICIYAMVTAGSQVWEGPPTGGTGTAGTAREMLEAQPAPAAGGVEPDAADAGQQKRGAAKPASSQAPASGPVVETPPGEEEFDPFFGEHFSEAEMASEYVGAYPKAESFEEAQKKLEILKIEKQIDRMGGKLARKLDVVTSRIHLDDHLKEQVLDMSLEGLNRIGQLRKGLAGQELSDEDRRVMKEDTRGIRHETRENLKSLLGDEKYEEFQRESRYFDNPNARVLDEVRDLKKQNRDLQKEITRQRKKSNRRKPRRNR